MFRMCQGIPKRTPGDCAQLQALDVERRRHSPSPGDGGGGRTLAEERVNGPDTSGVCSFEFDFEKCPWQFLSLLLVLHSITIIIYHCLV